MVEVFKTNVTDRLQAARLLEHIHKNLVDCKANFDLDDCDRILRIKHAGEIQASSVIKLLKEFGFNAEVLPDEVPALSLNT